MFFFFKFNDDKPNSVDSKNSLTGDDKLNFNYQSFIDEIVPLVTQANNFDVKDRTHTSDAFRKWRHTVDDLITKIGRQRFDINCNISNRRFRALWQSASARDELDAFNRDLNDTIYELELIIKQYEKYGDPHACKKNISLLEDVKGFELPDKVTLKWLYEHMPLSAWLWLVGLVIAAFTAGYNVHLIVTPAVPTNSATIVPTAQSGQIPH